MRSYSRLALLAALAGEARGNPNYKNMYSKGEVKARSGGVNIHGQTVYPEDHVLAPPGQVTLIVKTKSNQGVLAALGVGRQAVATSDHTVWNVNVKTEEAERIMTKLEKNSGVVRVEFDQMASLFPGEMDGEKDNSRRRQLRRLAEEEPYGIEMVLENVEWWKDKFENSPPTGSSKVCVVDTGYGDGHEDLPTLDRNSDGFNPYDEGEWYIDGNSHGSHCAGTIGAVGDNSKGVVGVIPNDLSDKFSFFIGKGLTDGGSGSFAGVMAAVQACVDNGSNVISMSLGGGGYSETHNEQYYGHYKNDDVLIIAAAGNGGNSDLGYPGSYKSLMSVAAVDSNENKASFSQYNEQIEIAGPGVSVKSTVTGDPAGSTFGYDSYSGTSMATPHVAGVAGLLRAYFPDCKAFQIRNAMIVTSKDKGASGCDVNYGHGIVQAKSAYEYLKANLATLCDPNESFKEPQGGCAEFSCTEDSDCDDGDPDTTDTCESGSCQNIYVCPDDAACDDGDTCTVDTCTDGVCTNIAPDCSTVTLKLTTDNYPGETEWSLTGSDGDELISGSGYSEANEEYSLSLYCADSGDELTFKITDSFGDGICCSYGSGGYVIEGRGVDVNGGEFDDSETETFTVEASQCDPTPPPVAPPVNSPTPPPVAPPTNPPVAPPVNSPTPPPVAPPTNPPVAPPVNSPTQPPVTAPTPTPGNPPALVVAHADTFTFTPVSACLGAGALGASGTTAGQCAQACAVLDECVGFEVFRKATPDFNEGDCVLSGTAACDNADDEAVWYYTREVNN